MNVPPGLSFSEGVPLYWMHEQSGRMKEIVRKFLDNQELNEWELEVFRWYIHQWVRAMPSKPNDYAMILIMSQDDLRKYVATTLLGLGIDPL